MLSHYNTHRTIPRRRGKQSRNNNDEGPEFHKVYCQRFFVTGPQSNLFAVTLPPSALEGNSSGRDKASKEGGLQLKDGTSVQLLADLVHEELQESSREQQ